MLCSSSQAAKELIRLVDRAPTLEGRRFRAMPNAFGVFPAQKWKQEQFPIGTNRSSEMLLKCPEDINDVDAGVLEFGLECTWCGSGWHSISCCEEWNDFNKSCPKGIEAIGGHDKCETCGTIDVHPLETCKAIELKGLAPRNAAYRTWLYQNSPESQKEIKRVPTHERREIQCHECKEWGHKARHCPNKPSRQKWGSFGGSG